MEATTKLEIVLEAQQWQQILDILQKTAIPYTISAPIINEIVQQAKEAEQTSPINGKGVQKWKQEQEEASGP